VTIARSSVREDDVIDPTASEDQFAVLVDSVAENRDAGALTSLLRESHAIYDQRSTAAIVRMRGWILLALAQVGLPADAVIFALEELDTGHDGYLVAAAALALRSSAPRPEFAPFVMRAIENMRFRDDAVAFDSYGAYATASDATTPVRELLVTLAWLGPLAGDIVPRLVELRAPGSGVSKKLLPDIDRTIDAIGRDRDDPPGRRSRARKPRALRATPGTPQGVPAAGSDCCEWHGSLGDVLRWPFGERADSEAVRMVAFEDHNGSPITYGQFFTGQPSIAAFFYTRCDNPQKCSLTVTKLARVQRLLAERGIAGQVRTAAITYDPGYDLPSRLLAYGRGRQLLMDDGHRLLRATSGIETLRRYFGLGVNFVESLVNRHRVEIYVLDAAGRISASFSRVHWDEREVVERAAEMLRDDEPGPAVAPVATAPSAPPGRLHAASTAMGTLASVGVALFPKCPICWLTYMSVLGISGLLPYSPGWELVLFAVMAVNLASVWWRCRSSGRMAGFHLAAAGAVAMVAMKIGLLPEQAAMPGVMLTLAGSLASVWSTRIQPRQLPPSVPS
jgi:protein SCO1/2